MERGEQVDDDRVTRLGPLRRGVVPLGVVAGAAEIPGGVQVHPLDAGLFGRIAVDAAQDGGDLDGLFEGEGFDEDERHWDIP